MNDWLVLARAILRSFARHGIDPVAIYLTGSHACDYAVPGSDIDCKVVIDLPAAHYHQPLLAAREQLPRRWPQLALNAVSLQQIKRKPRNDIKCSGRLIWGRDIRADIPPADPLGFAIGMSTGIEEKFLSRFASGWDVADGRNVLGTTSWITAFRLAWRQRVLPANKKDSFETYLLQDLPDRPFIGWVWRELRGTLSCRLPTATHAWCQREQQFWTMVARFRIECEELRPYQE